MIPTNLDQCTMMMTSLDQTMSNLVGHMKAVKISGQHPHVVHMHKHAATSLRMKPTAIDAKLKASNNRPRDHEKWSMEKALEQQGGVFPRGFENPKTNAGCPEITFRKLRLSDVDDVVGWYRDTRVIQFLGQSITSQKDGLQYIRMQKTAPWTRAICHGNRAIGKIFVDPDDEDYRVAEIGYLVSPEWRGRGVATKAVKMAVAAAFKKWPKLAWVEANVHKDNEWSRRVLEKAGFKWHRRTWYRLFRP